MIKALVASRSRNPVIDELASALRRSPAIASVETGTDAFWSAPAGSFDVVHVHWPEALLGWRKPSDADLGRLGDRLRWWNEHAAVIATVHNRRPHEPWRRGTFGRAYGILYASISGVIHMGAASRELFASDYPDACAAAATVIPHVMYTSFPNSISRDAARARLGLHASDIVALSFGYVRDPAEIRLLTGGFRRARLRRKRLLVAGQISKELGRLSHAAVRALVGATRGARPHFGFVEGEEVQTHFNAADFVVVPRSEVLNSGNVVLGFSFGKVVVGPATGVAGEILQQTGNPVYAPGDVKALARAMERAAELSKAGKGEQNLAYAQREWNHERVGQMHATFYQRVRNARLFEVG
jgi:glycosyltransferase involved in cell wall biosynthesis